MSTQTISSILTTCNTRPPLKNTDLIANLIGGAPSTLDTLKEIDAALNNDPNLASTLTTLIGTKLDSTTYTAEDILAKIKTVDGTNSGLDADLLEGMPPLGLPISVATQNALNLKAPLDSPVLVTPNIGVATGTSFNGITALASTTSPMDGVADVGTSTTVARVDHVHPSDTSRAPLDSPAFTGVPTAPTAPAGTCTDQIATTAFFTGAGFGGNQDYQNVTNSRAFGTTYTNSTGKPIGLCIRADHYDTSTATLNISLNGGGGFVFAAGTNSGGGNVCVGYFVVPNGFEYNVTSSDAQLTSWFELR